MSKHKQGFGMAPNPRSKLDRIQSAEETLKKLIPDFLNFRGKTSQVLSDLEQRDKEFRAEISEHGVGIEALLCLLADLTGVHRGILIRRFLEYRSDGFPHSNGIPKGQLIVQKYNFEEAKYESFIVQE